MSEALFDWWVIHRFDSPGQWGEICNGSPIAGLFARIWCAIDVVKSDLSFPVSMKHAPDMAEMIIAIKVSFTRRG